MPANLDELVVRVADICTYKWDMIRHRPLAYLLSGLAGGAMVVFGATLALAVSAGVSEKLAPGLANLLMGLVFMFSLVIIIMVSGMTLVTADMYIGVIGIFHRRINWGWFAWGITLGYAGNFIGSMFFMWLISKSGSYVSLPWLLKAHGIGAAKMGQTATQNIKKCFFRILTFIFFRNFMSLNIQGSTYLNSPHRLRKRLLIQHLRAPSPLS